MSIIKLKDNKAEREFRDELIKTHGFIFISKNGRKLYEVLSKEFPNIKTAFILVYTCEQSEDIYFVLVNNKNLLSVEISRINNEAPPIIEYMQLSEYKKKLSKINQIKLAVAIDLGSNEIKQT